MQKILRKKHNFTLQQIERALILKSWWAAFFILPLAKRAIHFFCNYTEISPNVFTLISFTLRIIAACFFTLGEYSFLIIGAIIFELAYLIDCMDGVIARLKEKTSVFGRYFDHISDLFCGVLLLTALAYSQRIFFSFLAIGIIYIYISEYYITFLTNLALEKQNNLSARIKNLKENKILKMILKYRNFFFERNFKSFFSLPDFEVLTLFIFPMIGQPVLGLKIGFGFIMIITLYKIFSSFIAIQTGSKNFP